MHFLVQNVLLKIKNKDTKIDFNLRTIKMTHVDINIYDSGSIFENGSNLERFEKSWISKKS